MCEPWLVGLTSLTSRGFLFESVEGLVRDIRNVTHDRGQRLTPFVRAARTVNAIREAIRKARQTDFS